MDNYNEQGPICQEEFFIFPNFFFWMLFSKLFISVFFTGRGFVV
jgi:hypothetical protein